MTKQVETKSRGILFKGPLVCAILDNRKTQTRRLMKPQPDMTGRVAFWKDCSFCEGGEKLPQAVFDQCPYGVPGDELWVKETWAPHPNGGHSILFRADANEDGSVPYLVNGSGMGGGVGDAYVDRWRSPLFLKRADSRLNLRITDVRVQRLQEISIYDIRDEGLDIAGLIAGFEVESEGAPGDDPEEFVEIACRDFAAGWNSINGPGSWESNPWVWAITFERITP